MAITREDLVWNQEFHFNHPSLCVVHIGPRGGVTYKQEIWRTNGKLQTWKRDPERFRLPIKHGMRSYSDIVPGDLDKWHLSKDCPVDQYFRDKDAEKRLERQRNAVDVILQS